MNTKNDESPPGVYMESFFGTRETVEKNDSDVLEKVWSAKKILLDSEATLRSGKVLLKSTPLARTISGLY